VELLAMAPKDSPAGNEEKRLAGIEIGNGEVIHFRSVEPSH
jgi:hypothetical protein